MTKPLGSIPIIAVIGGRSCSAHAYDLAYRVGWLLAGANAMLICGGMGGVMEAACKGASDNKGISIGILPTDDIRGANPYVTIPVATGMGIGRNIIICRMAQAIIAVSGV